MAIPYSELTTEQRDALALHIGINSEMSNEDYLKGNGRQRHNHGLENVGDLISIDYTGMTDADIADFKTRLNKLTDENKGEIESRIHGGNTGGIYSNIERITALGSDAFKTEIIQTISRSVAWEKGSEQGLEVVMATADIAADAGYTLATGGVAGLAKSAAKGVAGDVAEGLIHGKDAEGIATGVLKGAPIVGDLFGAVQGLSKISSQFEPVDKDQFHLAAPQARANWGPGGDVGISDLF